MNPFLALPLLVLAGCSSAPGVRQRLAEEFAKPGVILREPTNAPDHMSFEEACCRWAWQDSAAMQQVMKALAAGIDVRESRSWIWPRADLEFRANAALEEGGGSVRSSPSGGLYLRYDFEKVFFRLDAAAVSEAERDLCLQKARIAIDEAIGHFQDVLLEWCYLRDAVPLEKQRSAAFRRLLSVVDSLDQLGALPPGGFAEWKRREQSAQRACSESQRRLHALEDSLRSELGLASGAKLDFGDLGFLHNAYPLSSLPPGEGELRLWLPEVWQAHPACRVVELELFQTEMQILQAKRERLPRLTGAIGLGDIDTWVGGDFVEAAATAELGIRLPIFDAGTITRGIQKAALRRELARREVGILAGRLSRQVQSSLLSLRNSLEETANRQSECAELSKLSETAKLSANLGHGDPLLPFTLQVYKLEAELSIAEAKTRVAKSSRAYRVGLGQEPIPGLSNRILQTLVCDLEKPTAAAK